MMTEVKYADVLEATRRYMTGVGFAKSFQTYQGVADLMGFSRNGGSSWGRKSAQKFDGQVGRALNALTAGGELIKVGREEAGPGGNTDRQQCMRFWTPARYAEDVADGVAAQAEAQIIRTRLEAVYDWLTGQEIPMEQHPGQPLALSLDAWEKLVQLLADSPLCSSCHKPVGPVCWQCA